MRTDLAVGRGMAPAAIWRADSLLLVYNHTNTCVRQLQILSANVIPDMLETLKNAEEEKRELGDVVTYDKETYAKMSLSAEPD